MWRHLNTRHRIEDADFVVAAVVLAVEHELDLVGHRPVHVESRAVEQEGVGGLPVLRRGVHETGLQSGPQRDRRQWRLRAKRRGNEEQSTRQERGRRSSEHGHPFMCRARSAGRLLSYRETSTRSARVFTENCKRRSSFARNERAVFLGKTRVSCSGSDVTVGRRLRTRHRCRSFDAPHTALGGNRTQAWTALPGLRADACEGYFKTVAMASLLSLDRCAQSAYPRKIVCRGPPFFRRARTRVTSTLNPL